MFSLGTYIAFMDAIFLFWFFFLFARFRTERMCGFAATEPRPYKGGGQHRSPQLCTLVRSYIYL